MRSTARPRHYLPPPALTLTRPLLHYSVSREAYVLRLVGNRLGPVLRSDRRREQQSFTGRDRRQAVAHGKRTGSSPFPV